MGDAPPGTLGAYDIADLRDLEERLSQLRRRLAQGTGRIEMSPAEADAQVQASAPADTEHE